MPNLFPSECDPSDWTGPATEEFDGKPGPLFQRLLTEALLCELGDQVVPGPLKGTDGKVDILIKKGSAHSRRFTTQYPAIVECKFHAAANLHRREEEWKDLFRDLKRASEDGWKNVSDAWQTARSYIYCISHSLNADARTAMASLIATQLATLFRLDKTPLTIEVQVLTWDELSVWLNDDPFAALRDRWLGVPTSYLVTRDVYRRGLRSFRQWLDRLPFVDPEPTTPFHPRAIFAEVKASLGRAVVLHGPGGIGKTRTAFEVGALAEDAGWRVLHVVDLEKDADADALFRETGGASEQPTLLVYDYLDQATRFRLRDFLRRVEDDEVPLVVLGTARRMAPFRSLVYQELVSPVEIAPDARHARAICQRIHDRVSASARAFFGEARVAELCGQRPILALLIAEELNRRAASGIADLSHIRAGSAGLTVWLDLRLRADAYGAPLPASGIDPNRVAAAGVLAAAPQTRAALVDVARSVLTRCGASPLPAGDIVTTLTTAGWLEEDGEELAVVHGVVTDDILETLLIDDAGLVREAYLDAVLVPALGSARTLGRFAQSLGRLCAEQLRATNAQESIEKAARAWFAGNAYAIRMLIADAKDAAARSVTAYAVGAVLGNNVWGDELVQQWDIIVRPWLEANKTEPEARHLLYRALKQDAVRSLGDIVVSQSIDWLADPANRTKIYASFIIPSLLERLDGPRLKSIEPHVTAWLGEHAEHGQARYVITSALRRQRLPEALREAALAAGEMWLKEHPYHAAAPPLARLFLRKAPEEQAGRVRRALIGALSKKVESLAFVRFLLDVAGTEAEGAGATAVALLMLQQEELHPPDGMGLVIGMLRLPDLGEQHEAVLRAAIAWIQAHPETHGAASAVEALLERRDLGAYGAAAIDCALAWVSSRKQGEEAGRVFAALLALPLGLRERPVVDLAVRWLTRHRRSFDAGILLRWLLPAETLGSRIRDVSSIALDWVVRYRETPEAQFVIEATENLDDELKPRFTRLALDRLEDLGHGRGATYSARWLAQNMEMLSSGQITRFGRVVVTWLQDHEIDTDIDFVSNPLLRSSFVRDSNWQRVAAVVVAMMRRRGMHPQDDYVLQSLSERWYLLSADELQFVRERLDEYERHGGEVRSASRLRRTPITAEMLREALAAPQPPGPGLLRQVCDELGRRRHRHILNHRSDNVPLAVLAVWRCNDAGTRAELLAQLRREVIPAGNLRHLEQHRLRFAALVAGLDPALGIQLEAVLDSVGLSDRRMELWQILDAGIEERSLESVPAGDVVEALEAVRIALSARAADEGARWFARALPHVVRSNDEAAHTTARQLGREVLKQLDAEAAEAFRADCGRKLHRAGLDADADLILSRYGVEYKRLLAVELNRMVEGRDPASPEKVAEAVSVVRQLTAEGRDPAAGFVLEPALILAIRESYDDLVQELVKAGKVFLPRLRKGSHDKLRRQLYKRVRSSWSLYSRCRSVYAELGFDDRDLLVHFAAEHLEQRRGAADEELLAELRALAEEELANPGRHAAAIVPLRYLMPLTAWPSGELTPEVRELVRGAVVRLDARIRRDLARHAFDGIWKAHWPDAAKAEQELLALGLDDPENHVLDRRLYELIEQPGRAIAAAELEPFLAGAERRLDEATPGNAGYLLVPLLPLTARAGDAAFEARVHEIVQRRYLHEASTFSRAGLHNKSEQLLDAGAWPSKEEGEITLQRIGVSFRRIVRLVESGGPVPAAELRAALAATEPMLTNGRADDLAGGIAAILAASLRTQTLWREARALWSSFLRLSETTREDIDRVTLSLRDYVTSGACGDAGPARAALEELGVKPMRMTSLLEDATARVPPNVVRSGIRTADTILADAWSHRVGDYVRCLIPLSTRTGDAALEGAVDELVLRVREHPGLNADFVNGIGRGVLRTVPDSGAARGRLERLRLVSPPA